MRQLIPHHESSGIHWPTTYADFPASRRRLVILLLLATCMFLANTVFSPAEPAGAQLPTGCTEAGCVFTIAQGSDDAGSVIPYTPTGGCRGELLNAPEVYFGECPNGQDIISGFRFTNVTIPADRAISDMYLEFTTDGLYTNRVDTSIFGEASPNPPTFSNSSAPKYRATTALSVDWLITEPWSLGQTWRTPDLRMIFEQIKASGWQSGNAMAFIFKTGPTNPLSSTRRVTAFERTGMAPARLVVRFVSPAAPPSYTTSWYWQVNANGVLDYQTLSEDGCRQAEENPGDILVILDVGDPYFRGAYYGTTLPGTMVRLTTDQIKYGLIYYLEGYARCSWQKPNAHLTLAVGTNNTKIDMATAGRHGNAWAQMVNWLNDFFAGHSCTYRGDPYMIDCSIRDRIAVVGAIDAEPWGLCPMACYNTTTGQCDCARVEADPDVAIAWVEGYLAVASYPYINFGSCENCGFEGGPPPGTRWSQAKYQALSWGDGHAWVVPEIYNRSGANATQWKALSNYNRNTVGTGSDLVFKSVLTQLGDDGVHGQTCVADVTNTPNQGWMQLVGQLYNPGSGYFATTIGDLRWATDIAWTGPGSRDWSRKLDVLKQCKTVNDSSSGQ